MKNRTILNLFISILLIAGTVVALYRFRPFLQQFFYHDVFEQRLSEPVLGVYGLSNELTETEAKDIQHYTLKWEDKEDWTLREELQSGISPDKPALITIEMFTHSSYRSYLREMVKGKYDQKIRQVASNLSEREQVTYVRWNPEMEVPVKHFHWQNQSPELYIEAFRHFARLWKQTALDVNLVWGPAGYPGALEWWPGEDLVDFASVTLASPSELLSKSYPQEDAVPVMLRRKLHRMRFIDKPVLVLGSENLQGSSFKAQWLSKVSHDIQPYRQTPGQAEIERIQRGDAPAMATKLYATAKGGKEQSLLLGVYDPKQRLTGEESISVEHLFTDWPELRNGLFRQKFKEVIGRGHQVIVTVEPWLNVKNKDVEVLVNTVNGRYDKEIRELYDVVSNTTQTVYLRWAHEMENPIKRYSWQSQDPIDYIKCFRYFATFRQPVPDNICFIWGPAGDRGSLEWWPGDDVVDYINVAVYGLPDKNISDHKKQESFSKIFRRKFYRMRFVDKPIFITEFGVKGPEDFQRVWLEDAAHTINKYPEIVGVCYFNQPDVPKAWGEIKVPDWSISKGTFNHFTETLDIKKQPVTLW